MQGMQQAVNGAQRVAGALGANVGPGGGGGGTTPGAPVPNGPTMRGVLPMAMEMSTAAMEGMAAHVLIAGAAAAAGEAGLVLRGSALPVLGRAGVVGSLASLGSSLGLVIGRMISRRSVDLLGDKDSILRVFDNFCDLQVGVSLTVTDVVVASVTAFVVGGAMSAAVEAYQRSRLVQGKLGLDPVSRALLVGVAVALSQVASNRLTPKVARAVFSCSPLVATVAVPKK